MDTYTVMVDVTVLRNHGDAQRRELRVTGDLAAVRELYQGAAVQTMIGEALQDVVDAALAVAGEEEER